MFEVNLSTHSKIWEAQKNLGGHCPRISPWLRAYQPVWHSHCTRARFTVLVSWSDKLAVLSSLTSTPWPAEQRRLRSRSGSRTWSRKFWFKTGHGPEARVKLLVFTRAGYYLLLKLIFFLTGLLLRWIMALFSWLNWTVQGRLLRLADCWSGGLWAKK